MARRVRNANLETRSARAKLQRRGLPYWTRLEEGLHLGYRRLKGAGTWVVRFYLGRDVRWVYRGKESLKAYEKRVIGEADDYSDADAVKILTFDQAQAKARALMKGRTWAEAGIVEGPYTVARAIDDYVAFLKTSGKDARGAETRARALIIPPMGDIEVMALTSARLRKWLSDVAQQPARLRTRVGEPQHFKTASDERARKSTANRTLTILKAALNHAYDEKRVESNDAWGRRVKPFRSVEGVRLRYLTVDEAQRLINACGADLRDLVRAALETGCRLGELLRLIVSDFNRDTGTVFIAKSKSGKARHVVLTDQGAAIFHTLCIGRAGDESVWARAWNKTAVQRQMREALGRAKITPAITFHGLRHTWASLSVMNGIPLQVVAHNLGHADTRMVEKYYGHLAPSYVADVIRAGAPRFGAVRTNVREMHRGRQ